MTVTHEQAKKAAKWWREQVSSPTFDNGATDPGNLLAQSLAMALVPHLEDEQLNAFETALSEIIEIDQVAFISVDYHPDQTLSAAAAKAGLTSDLIFPWKTCMWIGDSDIQASVGYGAQPELID